MCQCLPTGDFLGTIMRRRNCAGLSLTETRHPAGARLPPHCHERAYFCLIRRGTYREDFDGGRRYCGPHMLAFHPPREVHAVPTNAELKVTRALELFNASEHPKTVSGVARSLGAPDVSVGARSDDGALVEIVVAAFVISPVLKPRPTHYPPNTPPKHALGGKLA